MTAWDEARTAIDAGDLAAVVAFVAALGEADRRAIGGTGRLIKEAERLARLLTAP